MDVPFTEWPLPAAAPGSSPSTPGSDVAPQLAQAIKFGLRYFETLHRAGLVPPEVQLGLVPPEIRAMHGALQQYERELRQAEDAAVVPRKELHP